MAAFRPTPGPLALVAAFWSCSATGPDPRLAIAIDGRLERGLTVRAEAIFQGAPVADALVEWTADPADRVRLLPGGLVTLLGEGRVTLQARAEVSPGRVEQTLLDLTVAVPPELVLDLLVDGNRDIYRVFLDGKSPVRLTSSPADDQDPTVAAGTVVFTSFRDGNGELYAVSWDGGPVERLTATGADEIQPALSPDGAMLAYTADPTGVFKLWTAGADGSGAAARTIGFGTGGSIEASPTWAPAGSELAFVSTTNGTADIFTLAPGQAPAPLILSPEAAVEPAWSPDGASVAFVSNSTGNAELFLFDIATAERTQLTDRPEADGEPAWLPDGRIVYTAWVGGVPTLRWLDPADPAEPVSIPLAFGEPRRAFGVPD